VGARGARRPRDSRACYRPSRPKVAWCSATKRSPIATFAVRLSLRAQLGIEAADIVIIEGVPRLEMGDDLLHELFANLAPATAAG
jgi:hypothetical protein